MVEEDRRAIVTNTFERHAQTALVLLLVALLVWVGNTTQKTQVTVAEMRVEVGYLKIAVESPPQYLELSKRVDSLQIRINIMEQQLHACCAGNQQGK